MRTLLLIALLAPTAALAQDTGRPSQSSQPNQPNQSRKTRRAEPAQTQAPAPRATARCADGQPCPGPVHSTGQLGTSSDTTSGGEAPAWSNDSTGANTTVGDPQGQPSSSP